MLLEALLLKTREELDEEKKYLLYSSGKSTSELIPCNDILYLESDGHKVHIRTDKTTYTMYGRLSNLLNQLPSTFMQCHKSYLVNMDKIKRIDKREIFLDNEKVLPISKSHNRNVKKAYYEYMCRR